MKTRELELIVARIDELKGLFRFGQRMLPLMEEFFQFLQEIVPLLEGINQSIQESTSKLPGATAELDKVTKATELATFEILDTVELITMKLFENSSVLGVLKEKRTKRAALNAELVKLVGGFNESASKEQISKLKALLQEETSLVDDETSYEGVISALNGMMESAQKITIALQVQDITSQQLAAVNHMVESVNVRLKHLLDVFDESELDRIINEEKTQSSSRPKVFDANASYDKTDKLQKVADDIHKEMKEKQTTKARDSEQHEAERQKLSSQEEIDKLFKS
jgi:hypothetical protein